MLQRTVEDQARQLYWHREKKRRRTPRRLLHESDELMFWLEECMVQDLRIVPGWLLPRLTALLQEADPKFSHQLGRQRRPAQVVEILYEVQEFLMNTSVKSREPAKIIPLFR
jgi:hypothetical protein